MKSRMKRAGYTPATWERATVTVLAVAVVGLVGFLVVRNEAFADPNLVVATRALLSLAIAVLGATIPGFLNVSWHGTGLLIRAGGALALFVLTYLLTPTVLPGLADEAIPPLTHPRKISAASSQGSSIMRVSGSRAAAQEDPAPLQLRAAYEGDADPYRKKFDVVLSNASTEQRILSTFHVRWLYSDGVLSSVDYGKALKPIERYSILLPVDPDEANQVLEKTVDIYPPVILPPRNESGPSIASIRLEVLYTFEGSWLNYHPNHDWDILYEVRVRDDSGGDVVVLSRSWRGGSAPNWVAKYDVERKTVKVTSTQAAPSTSDGIPLLVDTERSIRFPAGYRVTTTAYGPSGFTIVVFGNLSSNAQSLLKVQRVSDNDSRIYIDLQNGAQATYVSPAGDNGYVDFRLQTTKVQSQPLKGLQDPGEIEAGNMRRIVDGRGSLVAVEISDLARNFRVVVSWDRLVTAPK